MWNFALLLTLLTISLTSAAEISWESTPFNPPQLPLIVKSPYVSAWVKGNGTTLARQWPHFGTTNRILGWASYVKVDNQTYTIMGDPLTRAFNLTSQTQIKFTATQTIVSSHAGPVDLAITFLSPLDYTDLVRLSLPFSYVSVSVTTNDKNPHHVAVYMDVSGEWLTSDTTQTAKWSTTEDSILVHSMFLQESHRFAESQQRALWGTFFLASNLTAGTTYQTGRDTLVRGKFIADGRLDNSQDNNSRSIGATWPMLAICQDLGNVSHEVAETTFVLGHTRDPAAQPLPSGQQKPYQMYYFSNFSTTEVAVRFAINDYRNALAFATQFDSKVQSDAEKISPDYGPILALVTRQAFASMEIMGSGDEEGLQNAKVFTKDVALGQQSLTSGVFCTVDSLYAMMPMLIYTNPELGNHALSTLLEYATSYNEEFAMHDIGMRYGQVTAHDDQSRTPVEASANMIILTAAFMRYTGSAALAAKHYYTLKKWADYLSSSTSMHSPQLTSDWYQLSPVAAETNLELKRLIALRSIVEIQKAVGMSNESTTYNNTANNGLDQWINSTGSGTKYTYDGIRTLFLLHSLYADKILGLRFVPESVYARQREVYSNGEGEVYSDREGPFGIRLTSADTITSTTWQYFTLAALSKNSPRYDDHLAMIKNFTKKPQPDDLEIWAPGDVYDVVTGEAYSGYGGRGHAGGAYAILALDVEPQNITPVIASPSLIATPTSTSSVASPGAATSEGRAGPRYNWYLLGAALTLGFFQIT